MSKQILSTTAPLPMLQPADTGLLQQVFEVFPDAVVLIDEHFRFTYANQLAMELCGRSDMVGHNIFEIFPGNLEEPFHSTYRKTMEQRTEGAFEAFHPAPLNKWLRVTAKPFQIGIAVFFSDITLRKEAELRERESARRLAQALAVTSDAVASVDRNWRYTFLNENAYRLIDPERRLIGKVLWEAFPEIAGMATGRMCHLAMDAGIAGHIEEYFQPPLDTWFSVQCEPSADGIVIFFRDVTQQRQHEQVVRGQLDLLRSVQAAARLATWEHDPATGSLAFGPEAFDVFGHPAATLDTMGKFEAIMLPQFVGEMQSRARQAFESGEPLLMEFAVTAADGRTIWVESRAQRVSGSGGTATLGGMSIDIDDRRRSQQDLIASEARYRVLADLNPHAIWMGDAAGNITYANVGFLNYIGLSSGDLSGEGWLNAFGPEERERVLEVWGHSVRTGEEYHFEGLLRHAESGEYRYWRLRAAPVRDAAGDVLHWIGVGEDIHESRTYTAKLRAEQIESERRRLELESIYATTPIGLALLDPVHLTFLNMNEHEAEMLGSSKESLIGRPLSEIAPPDKIPGLLEMMRSVAGGEVISNRLLEGELAARPGEQRAWSVNYRPVYNEDGTVRAISTASMEITHQRKAEAALIQSEKLAAVGRLASSISHEINNPLEAITNLLYLIGLDGSLPEPLKLYVHMAQSELSRVSQIATQTLRFHRQAVAPTAVTAAELVDAVVRLYTGRLANSHIKVEAQYRTVTRILCFENDIRQVLNNLIANAIDAMRTGGRLLVRANATSFPAPGVRISIADTGHGMSAEVAARIFEPFFTTKDLNGTGLGLWISAGIMDRHQGRIRVRSWTREGCSGTVFTLFLPLEERQGNA